MEKEGILWFFIATISHIQSSNRNLLKNKKAIELDTEKDIKKEAKKLAKENDGWNKAHTLSFLRNKYQSENRTKLMWSENMMNHNQ